MKNSVCIITGSGGLIGSEAVRFFSKQFDKVIGIDNDSRQIFFGKESSVLPSIKHHIDNVKNYSHLNVNICSFYGLEDIFKEHKDSIKLIIHTAAQPSHDLAAKIPRDDFETNVVGTFNLLELTRNYCKEAVFIFTSTNKVYGDKPNFLPLIKTEWRYTIDPTRKTSFYPEVSEFGINERMSIDQTTHSLFGAGKASADIYVQEYGRYFNMNTVCFRGGCLTGENHQSAELHGFLSYLVKCIIHEKKYTIYGYDGLQVRDNIYSYDLITAFNEFYKKPRVGEVYNIGGSNYSNCSMIEAISMIENFSDKKAIIEYNETNRIGDHKWWISDIRKFLLHYPKWQFEYSLKDIVKKIISYELNNLKNGK